MNPPAPPQRVELDFEGGAPSPQRTTAAGLLVDGGRVLLECRPKDARVAPGLWDSPGGHLESGETPERALARELREELGIEVRRAALLLVEDEWEAHACTSYRHYVFLVLAWSGEARSLEGRITRWFDPTAALALEALHPITRRAIERWRGA